MISALSLLMAASIASADYCDNCSENVIEQIDNIDGVTVLHNRKGCGGCPAFRVTSESACRKLDNLGIINCEWPDPIDVSPEGSNEATENVEHHVAPCPTCVDNYQELLEVKGGCENGSEENDEMIIRKYPTPESDDNANLYKAATFISIAAIIGSLYAILGGKNEEKEMSGL